MSILEHYRRLDPLVGLFTEDAALVRQDRAPELEWIGTGSLSTGRPIRYPGASVLVVTDDRITGFRTYYDSAVFLTGTSGNDGERSGDAVEEPP